jgi:hypothetical protein
MLGVWRGYGVGLAFSTSALFNYGSFLTYKCYMSAGQLWDSEVGNRGEGGECKGE